MNYESIPSILLIITKVLQPKAEEENLSLLTNYFTEASSSIIVSLVFTTPLGYTTKAKLEIQ